ncbi:MAG: exopolysaccharide biosynthesis polyprenyl glycosylphosphotransferase [Streptosporangiales bacterium]|nr:exopolysaccharide biosynthesis polyprenyl glycosylphosphotransferase [Streptosporangiales bacterium]
MTGDKAEASSAQVDAPTGWATKLAAPGDMSPGDMSTAHGDEMAPCLPKQQARSAASHWGTIAARALLPACDAFGLTAAALLVAAPAWFAFGYTAAVFVALNLGGRHRLRMCLRMADELLPLAGCAALPLLALLPWAASPGGLARLAVVSAGLLMAVRAGSYAVARAARRRRWLADPALIVGTGALGVEVGELLRQHPEFGARPVGFLDGLPPGPESSFPLLGGLPDMADAVSRHGVRRIIVCFPAVSDAELVTVLRSGGALGADVCVVPRMYELGAAIPASRDEVWGVPLVPLRRRDVGGIGPYGRLTKRAFDLVVGAVLLLVLAPVLLVLAAVTARGGRPALFRQARVTAGGRVVEIVKLRTATEEAPDTQWTVPPERLSALARWLRATHLDELPQLLNVLRGEMSLIGPRPERPYFASRFAEVIPRYGDRHRVRAGMTGWAQVNGLYGDTSISERARFDNYYIEHWSLWLDLVILARTLATALMRRERP